MYKKNKPDVYVKSILPGFISGLMWGIAQTGWFYANAIVSQVVSYPIISCGPTIISSIWGMTLYKEITGKKNAILIVVVALVLIAGACCIGYSKILYVCYIKQMKSLVGLTMEFTSSFD